MAESSATTSTVSLSSNDLSLQQISQLEKLRELRYSIINVLSLKSTILSKTNQLEVQLNLSQQLENEKKMLMEEKRTLVEMLSGIQKDLDAISLACQRLEVEKKSLQKSLQSLKEDEYEPLIASVNSQRRHFNLSALPSLQEEQDAKIAAYLEERREGWLEGESSVYAMSNPTPAASASGSSSNSNLNMRARKREREKEREKEYEGDRGATKERERECDEDAEWDSAAKRVEKKRRGRPVKKKE